MFREWFRMIVAFMCQVEQHCSQEVTVTPQGFGGFQERRWTDREHTSTILSVRVSVCTVDHGTVPRSGKSAAWWSNFHRLRFTVLVLSAGGVQVCTQTS
jgi:hypothetical protein